MSRFDEIEKKYQEYLNMIKTEGVNLLKEEFNDVFASHSDVEAFAWSQWTPYFNDGDECVFSFHGLEVRLFGDPKEVEEDDENWDEDANLSYQGFKQVDNLVQNWGYIDGKWQRLSSPVVLYPRYNELLDLEATLKKNEEVLKHAFGDHSQIIVTREKFEVTEFTDHY